jgi:hypothetical protein
MAYSAFSTCSNDAFFGLVGKRFTMSMLLLPELARENAASNRRIAHSVESAARDFGQLRPPEDQIQSVRQQTTRIWREALGYTLRQAVEARNLWQSARALLEEGLEKDEAVTVVQAAVEVFDSWIKLLEPTRELWQAAAQYGANLDGFIDLNSASVDLLALRDTAEQLRGFLVGPRAPVDPGLLDEARQAMAQGRFKSPEAIRAGRRRQ